MSNEDTYTISVNNHDVVFDDKHQTGLSVKEAAESQGAGIDSEFVLSQELPNGKTKIVGDEDKITLKDEMQLQSHPSAVDVTQMAGRLAFGLESVSVPLSHCRG